MTQIVNVELPRVQQILKMEQQNLKYQLVKGKAHYVCYKKLEALWQEMLRSNSQESKLIQRIFTKVSKENVSERNGFGFDIDDMLWNRISASTCPAIKKPDNCLIEDLKEKMQKAHVIVTNHAYFFSDLIMRKKTGNGSLPTYDAVIFDEAHELEDVCCNIFEKEVDLNRFETLFDFLFKRNAINDLDMSIQLELTQLRQSFTKKLDEVYATVGNRMKNDAFKLMDEKIEMLKFARS